MFHLLVSSLLKFVVSTEPGHPGILIGLAILQSAQVGLVEVTFVYLLVPTTQAVGM